MTTAQSGVIITPVSSFSVTFRGGAELTLDSPSASQHNYLTNDPSRRTSQMVRLTFAEDTGIVSNVTQFGAEALAGSLNLATLQPNLTSYVPDTRTRKFPYNPAEAARIRV